MWFSEIKTGEPDRVTVSGPKVQEKGKQKRLREGWTQGLKLTPATWCSDHRTRAQNHITRAINVAARDSCFGLVRSH